MCLFFFCCVYYHTDAFLVLVVSGLTHRSDICVHNLILNHQGLAEQKMQYPLEYGYSMVGRPVAFGEGVDPADWLLPDSNSSSNGDLASKTTAAAVGPAPLVFCFHPHASSCEVAASGLMPVPPGIAASDAVFLPAVETALSIVHDAHPRVGERVAVFGQGLVGLLVTTILGRSGFHVIAVDGRTDRRRLALQCGASEAVSPPSGASASKQVALQRCVDIAVEVSGNPKALQAALNATMKGGKVRLRIFQIIIVNRKCGRKYVF